MQEILERAERLGFDVGEIRGARNAGAAASRAAEPELLVRWQGFGEACDTWEPFDVIAAAVPVLVRNYLLGLPESRAAVRRELLVRLQDATDA